MPARPAALVPARHDGLRVSSRHPPDAVKPFLRQQLERFPVRLQELDFFLSQPDVVKDMERFRELTREHAEVTEVNGVYQRFLQRERDSRRRAR